MLCEHCKKEQNEIYGSGRFCSPQCARSFSTFKKRKEINKKVSNTLKGYRTIPGGKIKLCDYGCGNEAKYQFKNNEWCCENSQNKCSEVKRKNSKTKQNILNIRNIKPFVQKESNCLYCKKELIKTQRKYCSIKCQNDYRYEIWINEWLCNKINGNVKSGSSNYIKRWLIKTYGEKCSICGWNKINKTTNKVSIEVDHIDGNYSNNKSENLRLLCPNCHSLTSTYKALNKGNGRKFRNKKCRNN